MLIFDGHLDLAMNAIQWNRDITRPLAEVRRRETGQADKVDRGNNTVTLPEMRTGGVGICIATQIGHSVAENSPTPGWNSPEIAWAVTQSQLAWYQAMHEQSEMRQIVDLAGLRSHSAQWLAGPQSDSQTNPLPIGFILSLEGADSILTIDHLERAFEYGLRAVGPAHYGVGRYSPGTGAEGGLTPAGRDLIAKMSELGLILDLTHLTDEAFWEALEIYTGPMVWASHNNCRSLTPHQRQFSDEQIKAIIERQGIIGVAFDAWMMIPDWVRHQTTPESAGLKLDTIINHVDHICQLAGNADHVGLGSDLDGGYGNEQTPADLNSIADLRKLIPLLTSRGYSNDDVAGIMHQNWLDVLERAWS